MPAPTPSTFGERIATARRSKRLSQRMLAKAVGLTEHTLSQLETGRCRSLQSGTVRKIARVLEVKTDWLLGMDLPESEVIDTLRQGESA